MIQSNSLLLRVDHVMEALDALLAAAAFALHFDGWDQLDLRSSLHRLW